MENRLELMTEERMKRSLRRISLEILEKHAGNGMLFVFGLNTRGYKIAKSICKTFLEISSLSIKPIRLSVDEEKIYGKHLDLNNAFVVLIDDVIFSGETLHKAINMLSNYGKPESITIAALIDRGHRKYPLQPDFIGMVQPTKLNEHVSVMLPDNDGKNRVILAVD